MRLTFYQTEPNVCRKILWSSDTDCAQNEDVIVYTNTQHTELFLRECFFAYICYSVQLVKLEAWI